jgi:hypothetical protein
MANVLCLAQLEIRRISLDREKFLFSLWARDFTLGGLRVKKKNQKKNVTLGPREGIFKLHYLKIKKRIEKF